ncbi:MAG: hypothetical protein Q4D96_10205 [Propionibacteriaceae bacterium]|nr:hypothetical protein [Propionibacteriaceae bacterium]
MILNTTDIHPSESPSPAAAQLVDQISQTLSPLAVLVGTRAIRSVQTSLEARAERVVATLEGKSGKKATATAEAVIAAIFGADEPEPTWWGTTLGELVSTHIEDTGVTLTHASEILGVRPQTVSVLLKREALIPILSKGGPRLVSRASVLERKRSMSTDARSRTWAAKSWN